MSGRPRPNRPIHAAEDPSQAHLWRQTLDNLALLPRTQDTQAHLRLQGLFEEGTMEEVGRGVREKVIQKLAEEEQQLDKELQAYDAALENISVLLALQQASSPPSMPSASTPNAPGKARLGRPPKNAAPSRSSSVSRASAPPPPAAPLVPGHPSEYPPIPSYHTIPLQDRNPKERKMELAAQLPLAPGRRVVFRVPSKPTGGSKSEPASDDWILAVIHKSLGQDSSRYEVLDADPETMGTAEEGKHNTTLKSIVPLPMMGAPLDSPAHPSYFAPFAPNTLVMAMYPDTTAFYRAIVVARETERPKEKDKEKKKGSSKGMVAVPEGEQRYLVQFEDDEGSTKVIEQCDIAEWPGGQLDR